MYKTGMNYGADNQPNMQSNTSWCKRPLMLSVIRVRMIYTYQEWINRI